MIKWFENLQNKGELKFLQFDIVDYYSSISKELFTEAVEWAKNFTNISEKEEKAIFEAKQSILFDGASNWKKKGDG